MDSLSDVLNHVRFKGTLYSLSEFSAPWGLSMPDQKGHAFFLMLLRGSCVVTFKGIEKPYYLAGGELILSPKAAVQTLQDSLSSNVTPIEEALASQPGRAGIIKFGGGGVITIAMLGCFEFESHGKNPLIESLPDVIYLNAEHLQSEPWLETILRQLAAEVEQNRPGSDILVSRLTDMVFVQAVRAYITQIKKCPETPGWLKAIGDPKIGASIRLMHENPAAPWTVASLAEAVGLSRTSFATKFTFLVSESPIEYLTSWRMQKALNLLEHGESNVSEIAGAVGYASEFAFAKAFKREVGCGPGEYRRKLYQRR